MPQNGGSCECIVEKSPDPNNKMRGDILFGLSYKESASIAIGGEVENLADLMEGHFFFSSGSTT